MLVAFDSEEFVHVADAKTEIPVVGPEISVVWMLLFAEKLETGDAMLAVIVTGPEFCDVVPVALSVSVTETVCPRVVPTEDEDADGNVTETDMLPVGWVV